MTKDCALRRGRLLASCPPTPATSQHQHGSREWCVVSPEVSVPLTKIVRMPIAISPRRSLPQPSFDTALLPPLLFFAVPVFLISTRIYKYLKPASAQTYDPKTGIGRGAPGFTTNTRKVAIPRHLAERIRAGEDVSAEEVTAALEEERERLEKEEREQREREEAEARGKKTMKVPESVDEDWLPAGATQKGGQARRRKK